METKQPKILVIGAGGIGGITAAHIARTGYDIEIVDIQPGLADKITEEGIHVRGMRGDFRVRVNAFADIRQVREKKDVVLIATKANSLEQVARDIKAALSENAVIVSMQNGMCPEYLSGIFGDQKVIGCIIGWGATVHGPCELEMTSKGDLVIGYQGSRKPFHFDFVREILSTIAPVILTDNLHGYLYSKLIINSCITTLGALCGLTLGKMLAKRKARNIFIHIIREGIAVGKALGIKVEKYGGKVDFYKIADDTTRIGQTRSHLIIRIIGLKYRRLKSSSLQSLQAGQPTEVDFLNGYLARQAKSLNIPAPLNDFLIQTIHEIEEGKRAIVPENLDLPFFDQYM
ncbi:MAG TPA: 2-dehydropantoate 2-reductase [Bacteroidales bacterium]|nr:2-dehydropantoate 2-reductase [Bacteroidales bacterium]